jgi:hypothetical protein
MWSGGSTTLTRWEQSWNEATAVRQAARCLRCDYGKTVVSKGVKQ